MKYGLIDANKTALPIDRMCGLLQVSVSGYYAWRQRTPSLRQRDDMVLLAHVRAQFAASGETYGSPRMHVELREEGLAVGRHRVARLMRENGLKAFQKRRWRRTTDSRHTHPVAPNILDQDFACDGPDQKWGADISYIWMAEGWLYLAVVVDLFSRRIVGWAVSDRMKKDLALSALRRALLRRGPAHGLIHHADRGSQYCSDAYLALLKTHRIVISMSGKGNCFDNAMVLRRENSPPDCFLILLTVFKTIKADLVWRTLFQTRQQAERALGRYIDGFYNPVRRHSAMGYVSPIAFEAAARKTEPVSLH